MRALALALVAFGASAETVEEERARVQAQLQAEKDALEALQASKADVLTLLDAMERLSRDSQVRVAALEKQAEGLSARIAAAVALEDLADGAVREQHRLLAPRLVGLYRVTRQDRLGFLLSAADFAELMRRSRAMYSLVARDLEVLRGLRDASRFQSLARLHLSSLRKFADAKVAALRHEQALARARRARFDEVLSALQAESARASRLVQNLEHAERQLASMVAEMHSTASSGFRALKGQLPWPAKGIIEVGFGKIVNPRFNTVVQHKGVDLRARKGTPVVSVAEGKVAWSGWLKGYGNLAIVDHGGSYHSLYAHLDSLQVSVGDGLEGGEVLGTVGDTGSLKGAYLYFEIRHRGMAVDPAPWLSPE